MRGKRIVILGVGAIGGSVAADLIKAGLDVTLVDQWPAHVAAMQGNGLAVEMPGEKLQIDVRALHLCDLCTLTRKFDIALLGVKAYDARWSAELIKPYLEAEGLVVGLQNSMCDDEIAAAVGRVRTVGTVVELSAEIFTPGRIQRNTPHAKTWFGLGALDESNRPRLPELDELLRLVGRVSVLEDIVAAKWTKLIANAMMLGTLGMMGMRLAAALEMPEIRAMVIEVGKESIAVAAACGYAVQPVFGLRRDELLGSPAAVARKLTDTLIEHIGTHARAAVTQDHMKGRYSEVDCINGLISRKGHEVGLLTPYNDAVVEITRRIRNGELAPGIGNLAIAERLLQD